MRATMSLDQILLLRHDTWSLQTGSMKYAGTDSSVYLLITGVSGEKTSFAKLDNSFRDDFERGQADQFKVKLEDIGKPLIITLSELLRL